MATVAASDTCLLCRMVDKAKCVVRKHTRLSESHREVKHTRTHTHTHTHTHTTNTVYSYMHKFMQMYGYLVGASRCRACIHAYLRKCSCGKSASGQKIPRPNTSTNSRRLSSQLFGLVDSGRAFQSPRRSTVIAAVTCVRCVCKECKENEWVETGG